MLAAAVPSLSKVPAPMPHKDYIGISMQDTCYIPRASAPAVMCLHEPVLFGRTKRDKAWDHVDNSCIYWANFKGDGRPQVLIEWHMNREDRN